MAETFCSSGTVVLKVGANATTLTAAKYTTLINQAESYICNVTRINYMDTYSTLNSDVKLLLEDATSSHAAIAVILHRIEDFSLAVAQTQLNVNYTRLTDAIKLLKEKETTDFITGA